MPRRVTGNNNQQQRQIAMAIKNAREMALLPYTSRVTTQRGRPRGDDDRGRPSAIAVIAATVPAVARSPPSEFQSLETPATPTPDAPAPETAEVEA